MVDLHESSGTFLRTVPPEVRAGGVPHPPPTQWSSLGPVSEAEGVSPLNFAFSSSMVQAWLWPRRGVLTLQKLGNLSNQESYFFPSLTNSPHCSRCSLFEGPSRLWPLASPGAGLLGLPGGGLWAWLWGPDCENTWLPRGLAARASPRARGPSYCFQSPAERCAEGQRVLFEKRDCVIYSRRGLGQLGLWTVGRWKRAGRMLTG